MIFPVWQPGGMSGGLFIALIAVIHVFVAQFAIGGGLFLVAAERMALKEHSREMFAWAERHSTFFLLLTMVFGALTGVAIWLIISLVSPAGASLLIHEFYFFWAAEWVFFLAEIGVLIIYVRHFPSVREGRMAASRHMILGLFYTLFAFLSLFAINGILSFMLTPGAWLESRDAWDGFFNPSFWPALVFRSCLCLLLGGLFGLVTATSIPTPETRHRAVRMCANWILLPCIGLAAASYWYNQNLPIELQEAITRRTADIRPFVRSFLDTLPVVFFGGIILLIRMPRLASKPLMVVMLLLGLVVSGSFEWIRESARRPWLVSQYMYSNGITVEQGAQLRENGLFATSPWVRMVVSEREQQAMILPHKSNSTGSSSSAPSLVPGTPLSPLSVAALSPAGQLAYGKMLFAYQCSTCHGVNTMQLNIIPRIQHRGQAGVEALLAAQGTINPYMPPFFGTEKDRQALAVWLVSLTGRFENLSETSPNGQ